MRHRGQACSHLPAADRRAVAADGLGQLRLAQSGLLPSRGDRLPGQSEVRGDAQFALGQVEQARTSYSQALVKLDVASPQRRLLELKLTEVGGTPAKPEGKS